MSALQRTRGKHRGGVLIIALLFIVMFSALAVAVAAFSGINVRLGDNQRKLGNTRACAESGLAVTRYWLRNIAFSGTTAPGDRLAATTTRLQNELNAAGITNIQPVYDSSAMTIALQGPSSPNVPLDSSRQQSFSAVLRQTDPNTMRVEVTGRSGGVSRTLVSNFVFEERRHTVFDYGVATKGPLELSGNAEVLGININAYIDTNDVGALTLMGKSRIAGTVSVTGSDADTLVQVAGNASIGDLSGPAASRPPSTNYDTPKTEFPEMVPSYFYHYVATNTLDPATDTSGHLVLENVRIPARMTPWEFTGGATLKGIIYIEAPNVVTFAGSTTLCGVIVGNGDPTDHSGTNSITFTGSLTSEPMSLDSLPEPKFDGVRDELGTFLMAPGFRAEFQGSFITLSGAIAANGITFSGSSGGIVNGSVINYSPTLMQCGGSNDLTINRTDANVLRPAGFKPQTILRYDPSSYSEAL